MPGISGIKIPSWCRPERRRRVARDAQAMLARSSSPARADVLPLNALGFSWSETALLKKFWKSASETLVLFDIMLPLLAKTGIPFASKLNEIMVRPSVHVSNFARAYRAFCIAPPPDGREVFERLRTECAPRLAV